MYGRAMSLRITGGRLRGRRIAAPKGDGVRPTTGRVREAVFSILGQHLDGWRVLDLCAGAGTLGIEAASRGASEVVFVERARDHLRILRDNAALLRDVAEVEIKPTDALRAVAGLVRQGRTFDLVLLDPPYGKGLAASLVEAIGTADGLLSDGAVVVAETGPREVLPETVGALVRGAAREYGDTSVWIYRRDAGEA